MNRKLVVILTATTLSQLLFSLGCWSSDYKSRPIANERTVTTTSPSPKPDSSPSTGNENMANKNSSESEIKSGGFAANLPSAFARPTDDVGNKLLKEYGAVFVAKGGATPPNTVVFRDDNAVSTFQSNLARSSDTIGGVSIELQSAAMKALKEAVADASQNGLTITPKGNDAARRSYADTVELWASRVNPGLAHWSGKGRISAADAQRIKSLSPFDQVPEIFKLETNGMYFSKDLSKSIIYSVAPPGTSQHLSMLALDVTEHDNSRVRDILAKHGWFQTVVSDLPHFTYLGVSESDLPKLGLKKVSDGGRSFWVPDI
jgi:hypothetical protein